MSDRLLLKNMIFYGYHGAFSAEKELGQRFEVDLEVYTSLHYGADDPELAFSYVDAYTIIKDIVEEQEFQLPEILAENIADEILSAYDLEKVVVRVRKPFVPVGGVMDYLEVEITRYPRPLTSTAYEI